MACPPNTKLTCGTPTFATCISYQGELPGYSSLDQCADVEQVLEEHYDLITDIRTSINLQSLIGECISYPNSNPLTVNQVLTAMQNFICTQNETIQTMQSSIETLQEQVEALQQNNCP